MEIGQVLTVCINQSRFLQQYVTPEGSVSNSPSATSPDSPNSTVEAWELQLPYFFKNTTRRPCIVVDLHPWPIDRPIPVGGYADVTVVLVTGFNGLSPDDVLGGDTQRAVPIAPTSPHPAMIAPIRTIPAWPADKCPSYVLGYPIKVNSLFLGSLQTPTRLDDNSLQALRSHLLALGPMQARAGFDESWFDEEDEDDGMVDLGDVSRMDLSEIAV
jgi:hypothetical protein